MSVQVVPPGPKNNFLVGNVREFNADTLKYLLDLRQHGDIVMFHFGPFPVYIVNHPDYIHDMLVTQASSYYKAQSTKQVMWPIIGNGLFTNDGDFWKRQRRLMQPVFHAKRIGQYAQVMVDYALDLAKNWQNGSTRPIDKDMNSLTMRIIAKTLFDADITTEASEIGPIITESLALLEERFKQIFLAPNWLPTPLNRHMHRAVSSLDTVIQKFIDERRVTKEDKGDLLSLLLLAQDEDNSVMTDKQVRDEAMTLFGAGHETTAVTLMWVWYLLSQYPEVETRLHEELDRVLGGRTPTLNDLSQLTYTEQIIKEAMRLYPAAWAITRQVHEPVMLDKYPLKKRNIVIANVYGVQRDARFFPDPDRFDPDRFSPENEKNIPKYAYIPFGGGPRVCIGNAFSLMESRLILATLGQRYTLSLAPGHKVIPTRMFTLRSKYGMQMVVRERVEQVAAR